MMRVRRDVHISVSISVSISISQPPCFARSLQTACFNFSFSQKEESLCSIHFFFFFFFYLLLLLLLLLQTTILIHKYCYNAQIYRLMYHYCAWLDKTTSSDPFLHIIYSRGHVVSVFGIRLVLGVIQPTSRQCQLPSTGYSYIHTYIHTYTHTYIRTYIHTYIHTYVYTYIHMFIHTYIHTYIELSCNLMLEGFLVREETSWGQV